MNPIIIQSNLPRWLNKQADATTIWPFIFAVKKPLEGKLLDHEMVHMRQWEKGKWFGFFFKYLYYHFRYGYENNPYEVEARKMSGT